MICSPADIKVKLIVVSANNENTNIWWGFQGVVPSQNVASWAKYGFSVFLKQIVTFEETALHIFARVVL